jgi:hypothetical protein
MIRKLAIYSVIALMPGVAFAADTNANVPATGTAVTQSAGATAKTDATVKADTAKPDAKLVTKSHKVVHKTNSKAKVIPKPEASKS